MTRPEQAIWEKLRYGVKSYCEIAHGAQFDPQSPRIRLHEPTFGHDEISAALQCMLSTYVTMGDKVKSFEKQFAAYSGMGSAVMVNSGSSANLLIYAALANKAYPDHLKPGDEVIVPALSWATTVWPVIQHGLIPVVVDIDPDTLNIDPDQIEQAIGEKTRAVMPVHVYGNPCDMDAITDICQRHNLILIEDCCESLGGRYAGKLLGSFGQAGTFSFYYSHHITTIEGGICATNDADLAELMRILRAHGWVREVQNPDKYYARHPDIDPRFLFVNLGFNLRPTELQGAMGSVQLPKLDHFVEQRRATASRLLCGLEEYGDFLRFQKETEKGYHSWFGFPVTVKKSAAFGIADLRSHMERSGIETRPIICGNIAEQPALKMYPHRVINDLPHASYVMRSSIAIGCHHAISKNAADYMIGQFDDFIMNSRK